MKNFLWLNHSFNSFLRQIVERAMQRINLSHFRKKALQYRPVFRRFLTRLEKNPPIGLNKLAAEADRNLWKDIDCLSCANCCKTMSPTYSATDIRRISHFLGIKQKEFIKKWLIKDPDGDWINKSLPCQFLDLKTNKCSVYEVRPKDCAGFPHHNKRPMVEYMDTFKQNIELCPATFKMVQSMKTSLESGVRSRESAF